MADKKKKTKLPRQEKITGAEKKQHGLFKKRRGGIVLTKDEVKEIKAGRKKLRKDMRASGIKSRKEFELTASGLGLYFDKNRFWTLFWWFLWHRGGWLLLALGALAMGVLYLMSYIAELRGHFTISMSDDLFLEGFVLSESPDFSNPTSHLFCTPVENVPCISITDIPVNVDNMAASEHNGNYFAYTYYLRNEGENTVDYRWEIKLNAESKNLSTAAWVMVFEDGEMAFYARPNEDGKQEVLPSVGDTRDWAYIEAPLYDQARYPDAQYEVIRKTDMLTYWRLKPINFASDDMVAEGWQTEVKPMESHKYTVVIWLEGDDPDCTNDLIGGHLGLEVFMELME